MFTSYQHKTFLQSIFANDANPREKIDDLVKRYVGETFCLKSATVTAKRPRRWHYKRFVTHQYSSDVLNVVHHNTVGGYTWDKENWEVGFKKEKDLLMFILSYEESK